MPSQHRKHRGYKTQRLVAEYIAANGWPHAMSVGAGTQGSDVVGTPFDIEVKATKSWSPKTWLDQSRARTKANGRLGFCVIRLTGQGEMSVPDYAALIPLSTLVELLQYKYGHLQDQPKDSDIARCKGCDQLFIGICLSCQRRANASL